MQLHLLNPTTNAIESRIAVNNFNHAKQLVHYHESAVGKTYAAVLNGDPRLQRDVECISTYDGKWHTVGTEASCG